jgi:hypothetical protein
MGYCEHAVKIRNWQRTIVHSADPLLFLGALARWAVAVATAVVADTDVLASGL